MPARSSNIQEVLPVRAEIASRRPTDVFSGAILPGMAMAYQSSGFGSVVAIVGSIHRF